MNIIEKIRNILFKSDFEKTFVDLKRLSKIDNKLGTLYNLLKIINEKSSKQEYEKLITTLKGINFSSSPNTYFYFYFPIVSHILYFRPNYEKELLCYLIKPNFANGSTELEDLMNVIKGAMDFKLRTNKFFLTLEGKKWITKEFPNMKKEVEREIEKCFNEIPINIKAEL